LLFAVPTVAGSSIRTHCPAWFLVPSSAASFWCVWCEEGLMVAVHWRSYAKSLVPPSGHGHHRVNPDTALVFIMFFLTVARMYCPHSMRSCSTVSWIPRMSQLGLDSFQIYAFCCLSKWFHLFRIWKIVFLVSN
jgi:hypothetical protein